MLVINRLNCSRIIIKPMLNLRIMFLMGTSLTVAKMEQMLDKKKLVSIYISLKPNLARVVLTLIILLLMIGKQKCKYKNCR